MSLLSMRKYISIIGVNITLAVLSGCATTGNLPADANINAKELASYQNQYQNLARANWTPLTSGKAISYKQHSPIIPEIRQRLVALHDLQAYRPENPEYYDNTLEAGVQRFQTRHGLEPDGVIGKTTLEQLNVTPQERLAQLRDAITQWQALPKPNEQDQYLLVNLASYKLSIYQGDKKNLEMKVVVGNPGWPTPTLSSQIQTVVINPKWNVPRNITEKELIQKVVENKDYLQEENISVMDGWQKGAKKIDPATINWQEYVGSKDLPYRLVQSAGESNALGKIKFIFPNKEDVYLHDTPNKGAFNLTKRNLSHGCVRLQEPIALLNYLFDHDLINKKEQITEALTQSNQTKYYALNKYLPIHISRINAWVDDNGLLNFRN